MTSRAVRVLTAVVACAAAWSPRDARAQTPLGTAFTYQGRLGDAGNPANGAYDVQLILFDAASAGAQVGPTVTRDDVVVANGLFTVAVDFGGSSAAASAGSSSACDRARAPAPTWHWRRARS